MIIRPWPYFLPDIIFHGEIYCQKYLNRSVLHTNFVISFKNFHLSYNTVFLSIYLSITGIYTVCMEMCCKWACKDGVFCRCGATMCYTYLSKIKRVRLIFAWRRTRTSPVSCHACVSFVLFFIGIKKMSSSFRFRLGSSDVVR